MTLWQSAPTAASIGSRRAGTPKPKALYPIQCADIVFVAQPGTKSTIKFLGNPQYMFYAHLGESSRKNKRIRDHW
ncbi:MAG: hypothetical protein LBT59_10765 [Clostridiales bacterium]|nr:hypothetical protein [Clostridiales bacterium]